jgi:hypothetical protein
MPVVEVGIHGKEQHIEPSEDTLIYTNHTQKKYSQLVCLVPVVWDVDARLRASGT